MRKATPLLSRAFRRGGRSALSRLGHRQLTRRLLRSRVQHGHQRPRSISKYAYAGLAAAVPLSAFLLFQTHPSASEGHHAEESSSNADTQQPQEAAQQQEEEASSATPAASSTKGMSPLPEPEQWDYVLVGAGPASFAALMEIRKRDPQASVLIIAREDELPYQRPPLSKELWEAEDPQSRSFTNYMGQPESIFMDAQGKLLGEALDGLAMAPGDNAAARLPGTVTVMRRSLAWQIEASRHLLIVSTGLGPEIGASASVGGLSSPDEEPLRLVKYGKCLIATGGRPRRLKGVQPDAADQVMTFRTTRDFDRLEQAARQPKRIVVIGGGFLGTELAAALAKRSASVPGLSITQVFPEAGVMDAILPDYLRDHATELLRAAGVDVRPGRMVNSIASTRSVVAPSPQQLAPSLELLAQPSSVDTDKVAAVSQQQDTIVGGDNVVVAVAPDQAALVPAPEPSLHQQQQAAAAAADVVAEDNSVTVILDDGTHLEADLVVSAIGIEPNSSLVMGSGVEIDKQNGGIAVNAELLAHSDLWVAGDVASVYHPLFGRRRFEHFNHAISSGRLAGRNMTAAAAGSGEAGHYRTVPSYWGQIMDQEYEAVGITDSTLRTVSVWDRVAEDPSDQLPTSEQAPVPNPSYKRGYVYYLDEQQYPVGVVMWGVFGQVNAAKRLVRGPDRAMKPEDVVRWLTLEQAQEQGPEDPDVASSLQEAQQQSH